MWTIEIWLKPVKRWSKTGEALSFQEALEVVQTICQAHGTVTRATLRDSKPEEYCGIQALPYRGICYWTGSGGLVSLR